MCGFKELSVTAIGVRGADDLGISDGHICTHFL